MNATTLAVTPEAVRPVYQPSREGMVRNTRGSETLRQHVPVRCLLQNDITVKMVEGARALRDLVAEQKRQLTEDAELYVRSMMALYNANPTGRRGGFTITSYDDLLKVEFSVSDYRAVDGAVVAAQALVAEVLNDLMGQIDPWIRDLLDSAFNRDERTGKINVENLQKLKRVDIPHPKWPDACAAIEDSVRITGSQSYLRFYERDRQDDKWRAISLQFSAL
ncbi:DUF3164 family protein [Komagataeibacter sp. FNDCF1]|uniref:DUF3164 family protein n=1 Tax=Komagataeibacter sp. FNDCF1 TaxID=2878681 RepID=UPI001E3D1615|nr:DUF3164 family protein [Komagataeibacter sp. FNDCF1]MCE2563752.1 DUF3164 family protein [Komagataeibacter sp. FNDCF1]